MRRGRQFGASMLEPTKDQLRWEIDKLEASLADERNRRKRLEAKLKSLLIDEGIIKRPPKRRKRAKKNQPPQLAGLEA